MNIPLSIFPATLLRLILCGGGGLVPAWGPLACPDWSARAYAWDPTTSDVTFPRGMSEESSGPPRPLVTPEAWLMPLDAESPWAARLAMVAAGGDWSKGRARVKRSGFLWRWHIYAPQPNDHRATIASGLAFTARAAMLAADASK